jgi:hypothetical protein
LALRTPSELAEVCQLPGGWQLGRLNGLASPEVTAQIPENIDRFPSEERLERSVGYISKYGIVWVAPATGSRINKRLLKRVNPIP